MAFSFHTYRYCGPVNEYQVNGTITEAAGTPQYFSFGIAPPFIYGWQNYTSPDGLVLVAWLGDTANVTLAVAT